MKKGLLVIAVFLALMPLSGYAIETYETVFVDGQAPIFIDGDLSDWEWLGLEKAQISHYIPFSMEIEKPIVSDLSGWFTCFADNENLFIASYVVDDKIVTGNHGFGEGWMDDVVEICFDGDLKDITKPTLDINDGQITVVAENGALSYLAGRIPGLVAQIPYYWEARGVRAGYSPTTDGYIAEMMIPLDTLGLSSAEGKQIGFNIRILDDDSDGPAMVQGIMSWADDPKNTAPWTTEAYNRVSFTRALIIPPGMCAVSNSSAMSIGARSILIGLGAPDTNELASVTDDVNNALFAKDWDGALTALEPLDNYAWAQAIRGAIALHNGQFKEGIAWLDNYAKTVNDELSSEWAKTFPISFAEILIENDGKIDYIFSHNTVADGIFILNEYLKLNPDDEQAMKKIEWAWNAIQEGTIHTIATLIDITKYPASSDIYNWAKLVIARCYFFNGDVDKVYILVNDIISSTSDSKVKLNASLILTSLAQKESN